MEVAGEAKKGGERYLISGVGAGDRGEGWCQRGESRLTLVSVMNAKWMAIYKQDDKRKTEPEGRQGAHLDVLIINL